MGVSPLPQNYECTYVQHLAEYLITYFSEDTGIPVYWICHMDPIKYVRTYDFKLFSSWSDICNICLRNVTETSVALLSSRLDYARLKGKNQLDFKPFALCSSTWDRLPDCMWPGSEPVKGVHECVGGLLESLQLILEKEYVEYIIFFTNIQKSTCEYSACTIYNTNSYPSKIIFIIIPTTCSTGKG